MEDIITTINNIVWSNALVVLCFISGIYFSFRTRFSQIRNIKEMVGLLFSGQSSEKGISSFQGFWTALAGRLRSCDIAGVATSVAGC